MLVLFYLPKTCIQIFQLFISDDKINTSSRSPVKSVFHQPSQPLQKSSNRSDRRTSRQSTQQSQMQRTANQVRVITTFFVC